MKRIVKVVGLNVLSLFLLGGCFWLALDFWKNGGSDKYAEIFPTEIKSQNDLTRTVGLNEPLVLVFSTPVQGEKYVMGAQLEPSAKAKIKYDGPSRTLTISPLETWELETRYVLTLPENKNNRWAKVQGQKIEFSTLNFPEVQSIFPLDNSEEVLLDIESPIRVELKERAPEFSFDFSLNPSIELIMDAEEDDRIFKILPSQPLSAGTKYQLTVTAVLKNQKEKTKQIFQSGFLSLPERPIQWEQDLTLRVDQAKKYTRAKIFFGKYIDINLESQVMVIFQDGKALEAFVVSSGKRGMETPKGDHQIYNKAQRVWSKKYGLYMPYWMAIISDGSVGIHELPEWPGGFKEGAFHLGIPVSHGCVRLGVGSAQRVFDWAEIGTPVIVY